MFTILRKDFGGRVGDRYFKTWDAAKEAMHKDIEDCCKNLGGKVIGKTDRMNVAKGFYMYEQTADFPEQKEKCTWALIDGYFEDEPDE